MYPTYIETAKFQSESDAQRSFNWSYQTEKKHLELYNKAKAAVDREQDVELGDVQVCGVCGYTLEGDGPDVCPVCGAKKEKFNAYS